MPAAPLQAVKSPSGKLREAHMLWAISQMAEVPLNSRWLLYGNCQVTSRCLHKALPSLQGAQKSEFSHVLQTKLDTAIKCPFNPPSRKEGLHCTQFFQSQPQHLASSIQTWNYFGTPSLALGAAVSPFAPSGTLPVQLSLKGHQEFCRLVIKKIKCSHLQEFKSLVILFQKLHSLF